MKMINDKSNRIELNYSNKKTPILCPKCGKETGYYKEDLMFFVLSCDIICPYCKTIVILAKSMKFANNISGDKQ